MSTRREFLKLTTVAGVAAAASIQTGCSSSQNNVPQPSQDALEAAPGARLQSVTRREETLRRYEFDGDNFHMSWAQDDRLYVSVCDGLGYPDKAQDFFNNRIFALEGGPQDARFIDLPGYPRKVLVEKANDPGLLYYHAFGTFALDGAIYQYFTNIFGAVKLIYSPDNGRTWRNQDGSSPVVWESKEEQSPQTMVFFQEPQDTFPLLSVLQMGRNYEYNQDGYVYVYSPNGIAEGTMNQLVMFRVPKREILNRQAYEFFAGRTDAGDARWSQKIGERGVVHTFASGWVNKTAHPYAWHPSVVYNAPLGLYLMANWGMPSTAEGKWFARPSYLGFWTALNPWGPWTQIHEETAWMPGNDPAARAYQPQIVPKWIAPDGKSFWLAWTDFQHTPQYWTTLQQAFDAQSHDQFMKLMVKSRNYRPYYSFNLQRVDLEVGEPEKRR